MIRRQHRVLAVTTQRDEPDWLIDDLMVNLRDVVSDVLVHKVSRTGPWGHEGRQNLAKRDLLRAAGATWALFIDPDERLDHSAADYIPGIVASARLIDGTQAFGFPLREMWTPTAYRIDGSWGNKKPRVRLFWLRPESGMAYPNRPIHCGVAPRGSGRTAEVLPVNLYHLKNIEPENRAERAKAYMAADPEFAYQKPETAQRDWDWLTDETGLQLEEIPPGQGFTPPYTRPYEFKAPQ